MRCVDAVANPVNVLLDSSQCSPAETSMPDEANQRPDHTAPPSRSTAVHSEEDRPHLCQPDGSLCNTERVHLNEKATIAELVLAASKKKHAEPLQPWLLNFREESIGRAYESWQVGTAFTAVTSVVVGSVVTASLRLIRVALGTETTPGAYEAHQIWMFVTLVLVHLLIGGCAIYVRNSQLLYTRLILAMSTTSAITIAICMHAISRDVFMAEQCPGSAEVWIVAAVIAFLAPSIAMHLSVRLWVRPLIGCLMLQPVLVSPHLELVVRILLGFLLAGSLFVGYQTEKEKRLAFVHELELLSQCRTSAAENIRIERQLAQSKAEQIRLAEVSRTRAKTNEIEGDLSAQSHPNVNAFKSSNCITYNLRRSCPQQRSGISTTTAADQCSVLT